MRDMNELVEMICEQVVHWVRKCGADEDDLAELVLEAEDSIMTDDEAAAYPEIGKVVKASILF